mgnify:CR=1 FL=1
MSMILKRRSSLPSYNRLTNRLDDFENFFESFMRAPLLDQLRVLDNQTSMGAPSTNIVEMDDCYEIQVALPGLSRSDIDIDVTNSALTISSSDAYEASPEQKYSVKEFGFTSFSRTWSLPENIVYDNISAKFESGILNITIPYANNKENISRKIEIS